VNIVSVQQTCESCPSQWDVWTDDPTKLYVRYRFGRLKVFPYDEDGSTILFSMPLYNGVHGDSLHGRMTTTEMRNILQSLDF